MAVVLAPVVAWIFVPSLRPFMLIGGGLLLVGGIAWIIYRYQMRQTQVKVDSLQKPSDVPDTPPSLPAPKKPRYVTRKSVLTDAEIVFHNVLLKAVPEAPIFPKMRVADVMEAAERYSGDFLRISQKHFDWVLCHPVSFEPLIAIELDDSSHQWSHKQRKNDQVKDDAASEAGIVLLRFPWQREYDVAQIRERIAVVLDQIADAKDAQIANASRPSPVVVHPVCRPDQTAAVADSVQTAMEEMLRKRRAERSGRI
jgi:very-short-patch-repair endonuclease